VVKGSKTAFKTQEMIMKTTTQNAARAAAILLCGAIALGTLQVTAQAADGALPSKKVSYADLDISTPAGAKVLYGRIKVAARHVCALNGYNDLGEMQWVNQCTERAIDRAVKDVGSPELSALRPSSLIHVASN
jgi:UrcA family protein